MSIAIWAIADLHLSFGVPGKTMDLFGSHWTNHPEKIASFWKEKVKPEDLVLIAGDISWASKNNEVKPDLDWIGSLPGTKVMIRGNHDHWWQSFAKVRSLLPPSCHAIQNDSFAFHEYSIGGTRLWDTEEFNFDGFIEYRGEKPRRLLSNEDKTIFSREIHRLELSLKALDQTAKKRIVMTHYPPIGPDLLPSQASELLKAYNVDIVVCGHLHNIKKGVEIYKGSSSPSYHLVACDYLDFRLLPLINTSLA